MKRAPRHIRAHVVFVDTGAHYALLDSQDRYHQLANDFYRQIIKERLRLITTNFVLAESHTLILNTRRLGYWAARQFIEKMLAGPTIIKRVLPQDEARAWQIICQYEAKTFTYVDATSFAVMERLGVSRAFAFDTHFRQYGFTVLPETGS